MQRKNLYIIDGNAYCYRSYYAVGDLRNSAGQPTGAVFGFVNMLNRLKLEANPDYIAVCFDLKGPTVRHKMFKDYKANRKPMPDDLIPQMDTIKKVIRAYGVPIFEVDGYEADDIIASLAVQFSPDADVYIVSGDKDMLQLVNDNIKVYNPQKDSTVIDADKVIERYKITPGQITDFLALAGDSADNIPGVPGIGPKTATDLINTFGGLEDILANLDNITQKKRRESLEEFSEQARLSKRLATVIKDIEVPRVLEDLGVKSPDNDLLSSLFRELEFRNLLRTVLPKEEAFSSQVESLKIIDTEKKLTEVTKQLGAIKEVVLSVAVNPDDTDKINSIDLGFDNVDNCRINLQGELKLSDVVEPLNKILQDEKITKIGYDLKTVSLLLAKNEMFLKLPLFDILIAAYLLEPNRGMLKCEDIAQIYLGRNSYPNTRVSDFTQVKEVFEKELKDKELYELFSELEMPLVYILAAMETEGIAVDKTLLCNIGDQVNEKLEQIVGKIYKLSGCKFNINSTKQLREILFDKLNLPVLKKGKTGPSTDADVLLRLSQQHTLPALILEYRELAKLKSTYIDGLVDLINPQTNRIHTSFNQAITATGRLSSSAPNLQNIPIKTEAGREIRSVFVAKDKGWVLLSADYSQIELRVLAHLCRDEQLMYAFNQNMDIHTYTASLVFGMEQSVVTKKMRDVAKRVNFGIVYGMGPYGLARDIGVSHDEAKKFIADYFSRYPGVKEYMHSQVELAKSQGYVTTLLNRRRYIPQILARDAMGRNFAERTAMNTPIQGTAADLIKAAMVKVADILINNKLQSKMLLQVHDELVFDVPECEIEQMSEIVKETMEKAFILDVPIEVSLKIGKNWRDMS